MFLSDLVWRNCIEKVRCLRLLSLEVVSFRALCPRWDCYGSGSIVGMASALTKLVGMLARILLLSFIWDWNMMLASKLNDWLERLPPSLLALLINLDWAVVSPIWFDFWALSSKLFLKGTKLLFRITWNETVELLRLLRFSVTGLGNFLGFYWVSIYSFLQRLMSICAIYKGGLLLYLTNLVELVLGILICLFPLKGITRRLPLELELLADWLL